jgi:hypothetical protein
MASRQGNRVMSLIRYRPIIKNKEADMAVDVSGAWTSLTCYYTLHDKIVTLQAENERLLNLTKEMNDTINVSQAACRELKAKNECLKKSNKLSIYNPETKEFETRFEEPL